MPFLVMSICQIIAIALRIAIIVWAMRICYSNEQPDNFYKFIAATLAIIMYDVATMGTKPIENKSELFGN